MGLDPKLNITSEMATDSVQYMSTCWCHKPLEGKIITHLMMTKQLRYQGGYLTLSLPNLTDVEENNSKEIT